MALSEALQNAVFAFGGVPAERRTNSLCACYLDHGLYTHLGVVATRNNRRLANENGANRCAEALGYEGPIATGSGGWSSS
ncbi:hypothetical protein [Cyanobium sp. AMD-g]|uniref:hypothetical protein n=1 Tax=Cyanobium sp. AMD-g TaxID=2823699 RepID=UPI0020CD805A|nr:hypothetical protein [Cyanobium sp. AMD-g]